VFDNDMDFDDAAALAYLARLHKAGEIDLRLVSVTSAGAGLPGHAIRHARCLLERFGLADVPVVDSRVPGVHPFPDQLRYAMDAILYQVTPDCTASEAPSAVSAERAIVDVIGGSERPVTLFITGPATNVAGARALAAAQARPFASGIAHAWFHGAFGSGGLCCGLETVYDSTQPFNFWADPAASQDLFDNLLPQQIVIAGGPADPPIRAEYVQRLAAEGTTAEAQYVASVVSHPILQYAIASGLEVEWWDPLVVVAATRSGVADFELIWGAVLVEEGPSVGRIVELDPTEGQLVYHSVSGDPTAFEEQFLAGLNAPL
jgi:purine nucleosidase